MAGESIRHDDKIDNKLKKESKEVLSVPCGESIANTEKARVDHLQGCIDERCIRKWESFFP